jgi:5-methylcytosine-specific restriction endonuclease McrA
MIHQELRTSILERDNYTCSICLKSFKDDKLRLQHLIPIRLGGLDSINNLTAMCYKCHGLTELLNRVK